MDQIHKEVLGKMISNLRCFSEFLREVFSISDLKEIAVKETQKGPTQGAQTMLSILEKRGPKAYRLFVDVL